MECKKEQECQNCGLQLNRQNFIDSLVLLKIEHATCEEIQEVTTQTNSLIAKAEPEGNIKKKIKVKGARDVE